MSIQDAVLLLQGQWILQEGGANPKDLVYRCLNRLISPEMQLQMNRTGANQKCKFPPALEAALKGNIVLFNCGIIYMYMCCFRKVWIFSIDY